MPPSSKLLNSARMAWVLDWLQHLDASSCYVLSLRFQQSSLLPFRPLGFPQKLSMPHRTFLPEGLRYTSAIPPQFPRAPSLWAYTCVRAGSPRSVLEVDRWNFSFGGPGSPFGPVCCPCRSQFFIVFVVGSEAPAWKDCSGMSASQTLQHDEGRPCPGFGRDSTTHKRCSQKPQGSHAASGSWEPCPVRSPLTR